MDTPLTVDDAAHMLGTSARQVRRLIDAGELTGVRIHRSWLVDRESVASYRRLRPSPGRPLAPASAWKRLLTAQRPGSIDDLRDLAIEVRRRATRRPARALPALRRELLNTPEVVCGGRLALGDDRAEQWRLYVRQSQLDELVARVRLSLMPEEPNLLLAVVDDAAWPFDAADRTAPIRVIAVDLVDDGEERLARETLSDGNW